MGELVLLVFVAWFFGSLAKDDVKKCSTIECADRKITMYGVLFVIILGLWLSGYFPLEFLAMTGGGLLGAMHGKDEVSERVMEKEIKRRAKQEGCSKLPALEAELRRVREEMKSLKRAHNLGLGGQVADFFRSGQYAKLMDREAELEKEIEEIKRRYNC